MHTFYMMFIMIKTRDNGWNNTCCSACKKLKIQTLKTTPPDNIYFIHAIVRP